ncbi:MAG: conjugal transfer protein TraT [Proteobacteria bacterium]|nr:MAG: conjugal transfer protein TraT [Pseudomonadota bacterium]
MFQRGVKLLAVVCLLALFSGCAATQTAISKRNLDVQSKMSATVFLDPVAESKRTVFVQVRNTSDKDINVSKAIRQAIASHGYKIVSNPKHAHYMLQASILQVAQMSPSAAQNALAGGYGGALDGAVVGASLAAMSNNTSSSAYGGFGLLGAVIGTVANAAVKDVTFTMITDLQISERAAKGVVVHQQTGSDMSQGTSTHVSQQSSSKSSWKRYRTRIVSTANQVNLKFDDAKERLASGLARTVSGVF